MSADLLATAYLLARESRRRPRQSDLKRAVSTAYYALFHAIARNAANLLVGAHRADDAYDLWRQTYRALDHGHAKSACGRLNELKFRKSLCDCGAAFVELQQIRHKADYDPDDRVDRVEVLAIIGLAETALTNRLPLGDGI